MFKIGNRVRAKNDRTPSMECPLPVGKIYTIIGVSKNALGMPIYQLKELPKHQWYRESRLQVEEYPTFQKDEDYYAWLSKR